MFSYCSNSFPSCFPPSSSPSPFASAFLNHENTADNTQLLHDPLVLPFIPTNNNAQFPEIATNLAASDFAAIARQDASNNINAVHHHYGIPNFLAKKPAAKKDRHSKIHTSQGLRDRRVRLSIEIARKFFDLQDMLGFDKASSTLEWLFNKSKKAIKELASTKQISSAKSFSNSSSECEEVVSEINQEEKSLMAISEEKKLKKAQKEAVPIGDLQAKKESREKARARARERTSHSMKRKCPASALNPQILHQLRSPIIEASGRSPDNYKKLDQAQPSDELTPRDHNFNVIEESIVIKRKLKPSSMPSSNQQNFMIPKESTLNHNDQHSFPNLSPNWDTNGRSSFCAVASMNLSTELQFFGKPWEECNNQQRLH